MKFIFFICVNLFFLSFNLLAAGSMDLDENQTKFNEALESYKQKDFQKTEELLGEINEDISDNLNTKIITLNGNNAFQQSELFLKNPGESEKALEKIEQSIGYYKRILQLDNDNKNISNNLELAMVKREEILMKRSEEMQQQQQDQSTKDQLSELQKKQEELSSDNQKGTDDHKTQQEDLREKTSDLKKSTSSANEDLSKKLQEAVDYQNEALNAIEDDDFDNAEIYQDKAAKVLQKASDAVDGDKSDQPSQSEEGSEVSENERDQIAQSIIENENNRETSSESSGEGFTVDRNW